MNLAPAHCIVLPVLFHIPTRVLPTAFWAGAVCAMMSLLWQWYRQLPAPSHPFRFGVLRNSRLGKTSKCQLSGLKISPFFWGSHCTLYTQANIPGNCRIRCSHLTCMRHHTAEQLAWENTCNMLPPRRDSPLLIPTLCASQIAVLVQQSSGMRSDASKLWVKVQQNNFQMQCCRTAFQRRAAAFDGCETYDWELRTSENQNVC